MDSSVITSKKIGNHPIPVYTQWSSYKQGMITPTLLPLAFRIGTFSCIEQLSCGQERLGDAALRVFRRALDLHVIKHGDKFTDTYFNDRISYELFNTSDNARFVTFVPKPLLGYLQWMFPDHSFEELASRTESECLIRVTQCLEAGIWVGDHSDLSLKYVPVSFM